MIIASCIAAWQKLQQSAAGYHGGRKPVPQSSLAESEAGNDQAPVQMPRDYSEGASGLLRGGAKRD